MPPSRIRLLTLFVAPVWLASCALFQSSPSPTAPTEASPPQTSAVQDSAVQDSRTGPATTPDQALSADNASQPAIAEAPDLWERFRQHSRLNLTLDNPAIAAQRRYYQRHSALFDHAVTRGEPYFHYIQSGIERRNLPSEFLLIPLVESGFNPYARSPGGSVGLWQFIPSTARHFGLKTSWWFDERRDVVASTDAALNYLEILRDHFNGDWLLTMAAYNAGEGTVQQAIKRNQRLGKPTDFWSLDLPRHTRIYVPRMIAASQIFMQPERYGIQLKSIPFEPQFVSVDIRSQLDLDQAARMIGITQQTLRKLNPGLMQWATNPAGPHRLNVPPAQAGQFQQALANRSPTSHKQWDRYAVRSGDTLGGIARRYGIPVTELKRENHLKSDLLRVGANLRVPHVNRSARQLAAKPSAPLQPIPQGQQKILHTVTNGESLWSISKKYNVGMGQLARWNNKDRNKQLKAGEMLTLYLTPEKTH